MLNSVAISKEVKDEISSCSRSVMLFKYLQDIWVDTKRYLWQHVKSIDDAF